MSSRHIRAQNARQNATQGDPVTHGPAAAQVLPCDRLDTFFNSLAAFELIACTITLIYFLSQGLPLSHYIKALAVCASSVVATFGLYSVAKSARDQLDAFFDTLAVLESLVLIMALVFFYSQGLPLSYYQTACTVFALSIVAAFTVYSVTKSLLEVEFEWPTDKNLNLFHDISLPPAPAPGISDSKEDFSPFPGFNINSDDIRRPAPTPKSTQIYAFGEVDTINRIWTDTKSRKSHRKTRILGTVDHVSSIITPSQPGYVKALDLARSTEVIREQPTEEQQIVMSVYEARTKLLALMDQMEKDAERDGPTAAAYRHRKKLTDLFKAVRQGTLNSTFRDRLVRYAKAQDFSKTDRLWADGIALTQGGKVDCAKNDGLWKIVREIERSKERSLDMKGRAMEGAEEAMVKREREELTQLLKDVRNYAIKFGDKKSRQKFSADSYGKWHKEITSLLDQIHEVRNEKKRQKEAKLESIRDVVWETRDVDGARDGYLGERVKTLLHPKQAAEFWKSLDAELWAHEIAMIRKNPSKQLALFKEIGFDALRENLFNFDTSQHISTPPNPMHQWKISGYKLNFIQATKTYDRYEHVLGELVGKKNAHNKFTKIYNAEVAQHKLEWYFLMFMMILVVEDCKPVWYIDYWYAPYIATACKDTGLPQRAYWDHLSYREAMRKEHHLRSEEKAKADAAISTLAELLEEKLQVAATKQKQADAQGAAVSKAQEEVPAVQASAQQQAISPEQAESQAQEAQAHVDEACAEEDELFAAAIAELDAESDDDEEEEEEDFPAEEPISDEDATLLARERARIEAELAEKDAAVEAAQPAAEPIEEEDDFPEEEPISDEEAALMDQQRARVEAELAEETALAAKKAAVEADLLQAQILAIMALTEKEAAVEAAWFQFLANIALIEQEEFVEAAWINFQHRANATAAEEFRRSAQAQAHSAIMQLALANEIAASQAAVQQANSVENTSVILQSTASASSSSRLVNTTKPVMFFNTQPWNDDAGGFMTYWQNQQFKHPHATSTLMRKDGVLILKFARMNEDMYTERSRRTIHPLSGYSLVWRMAVKELAPPQRKYLRTSGQVWPRNWSMSNRKIWEPELKYGRWMPAQGFRLQRMAFNPFLTVFLGLDTSAEERRAARLTKDPEARKVEEHFAGIARKANIPLPKSEDEDLAEKKPTFWNPSAFKGPSTTTAPPTGGFDPSTFMNLTASLAQGPTIDPDDMVDLSSRGQMRSSRHEGLARGGRRARR